MPFMRSHCWARRARRAAFNYHSLNLECYFSIYIGICIYIFARPAVRRPEFTSITPHYFDIIGSFENYINRKQQPIYYTLIERDLLSQPGIIYIKSLLRQIKIFYFLFFSKVHNERV